MVYRRFQRPLTGMEIAKTGVKIVQVLREKRGWRLLAAQSIPFPEDTLKLSLKTENINEPQVFLDSFRELLEKFGRKVHRVGLAIPSEVIKVFINRYASLPKPGEEADKMIAWLAKKSLPFPAEQTHISHYLLGGRPGGVRTLLVTIGFRDVIREYELNLRELKIQPEIIRPAGINHFNFYCDHIPRGGIVAFMGLFENFFTFFVCAHGSVLFYHGGKRGFSDIHFFQDIDMTFHLFENENPGARIEKLFFGSEVGFARALEEGLRTLGEIEVVRMQETDLISMDSVSVGLSRGEICAYAAAIGAAQSLVQ
jgi:Type IV pilus assembly protein PilM